MMMILTADSSLNVHRLIPRRKVKHDSLLAENSSDLNNCCSDVSNSSSSGKVLNYDNDITNRQKVTPTFSSKESERAGTTEEEADDTSTASSKASSDDSDEEDDASHNSYSKSSIYCSSENISPLIKDSLDRSKLLDHIDYSKLSPGVNPENLSNYELLRLRNIQRNEAKLAQLGLLNITKGSTSKKNGRNVTKKQRQPTPARRTNETSSSSQEIYTKMIPLYTTPSHHQSQWNTRFSELTEFHATHSHFHIPNTTRQYKTLSAWLKRQQSQYKRYKNGEKSALDHEKVEMLEKLIGVGLSSTLDLITTSKSEGRDVRKDKVKEYPRVSNGKKRKLLMKEHDSNKGSDDEFNNIRTQDSESGLVRDNYSIFFSEESYCSQYKRKDDLLMNHIKQRRSRHQTKVNSEKRKGEQNLKIKNNRFLQDDSDEEEAALINRTYPKSTDKSSLRIGRVEDYSSSDLDEDRSVNIEVSEKSNINFNTSKSSHSKHRYRNQAVDDDTFIEQTVFSSKNAPRRARSQLEQIKESKKKKCSEKRYSTQRNLKRRGLIDKFQQSSDNGSRNNTSINYNSNKYIHRYDSNNIASEVKRQSSPSEEDGTRFITVPSQSLISYERIHALQYERNELLAEYARLYGRKCLVIEKTTRLEQQLRVATNILSGSGCRLLAAQETIKIFSDSGSLSPMTLGGMFDS